MRILVIDDQTRAKVRAVVEFAAHNWYRPGMSETVPGDDARCQVNLETYHCVFSFIQVGAPGTLYRHLLVSIPSEKYPGPFALYTIAELFGFTGWDGKSEEPPKDWLLNINPVEHCLVAAQKVK